MQRLRPPPTHQFPQAALMSRPAEKQQHGDGGMMGRVPSLYVPGSPLGKEATPGSRASSRSVAASMLDQQVSRWPRPRLCSHPRRQGAGAAD